jgi:outer membrane biosynthesis protein TonB
MLRPERALGADTTASLREPEIYGVYRFRLARTGSMDSVSIAIPSLAPGLDSAVITALQVASAEKTLPLFPDVLTEDTLSLQLRITSGPEEPRLRGNSQVLFQSMFPRLLVSDAVARAGNPAAPFPEEEQATGADGDVLIRGVIDVDGTPLVPTLEIVHATSRAFALSALRTIVRWQFVPAHVGTCPVQQVVLVPFWFSLRP